MALHHRQGSGDVRRLLMVLVLGVLTSFVVGWHWYLVQRLVLDPAWPTAIAKPAIAAIVFLGLTTIAQPISERLLRPGLARFVAWPASIWMGVGFWLMLLLGVSDFALWLTDSSALAADTASPLAALSAARTRALGVAGIALAALVPALRSGLSEPRLRRVAIRLPGWPAEWAGLRIVQISDIHIGSLLRRDFAQRLTERVNALDADLVVVTGDLVDGPVASLADEVAPFEALRGRLGVFFVTGNHDHYSGASSWVDHLRRMGFRVLRNERVALAPDPQEAERTFDLAGVDDYRQRRMPGEGGADIERALAGLSDERFVLLLAHDPSQFKQAAAMGVDLQLSGHTHGGQIWPFHYFVRLAIPFVAGLYRRGDSTLYVSRGTGFWGPPMRLFADAEITEIALLPELGVGEPASAAR